MALNDFWVCVFYAFSTLPKILYLIVKRFLISNGSKIIAMLLPPCVK